MARPTSLFNSERFITIAATGFTDGLYPQTHKAQLSVLMIDHPQKKQKVAYPVYLINLDDSTKRLATSERQLAQHHIPYHRISAINGKGQTCTDFPEYNARSSRRYYGRDMTGGEIACHLSHIKALQTFIASGRSHCLILEDDFLCKAHCWEIVDAVSALATEGVLGDWDLINLTRKVSGSGLKSPIHMIEIGSDRTELYNAFYFPTRAAAIMWSRAGATRFVEQHATPFCPIDHLFRKYVSETGRGLGLSHTPFWFTDEDSDIMAASPTWEKPTKVSFYRIKEFTRQAKCIFNAYRQKRTFDSKQ
jgi:glycosyl transferase, family 25